MVGGEDGLVAHRFRRDIPEVEFFIVSALLHLEHLIKIAVEDLAFVTDVDGAAAHQTFDGRGIEAVG